MKKSTDIMNDIPLPDPKLEEGRYIASIRYQIPNRIILHGRHKTSPRFETMYGIVYWLNKQPYNLDFVIYRTDKEGVVRHGSKKQKETLV